MLPAEVQDKLEDYMVRAVQFVYPGYPAMSERLRATSAEIADWEAAGRPHDEFMTMTRSVWDHPTYVSGLKRGLAWSQDTTLTPAESLTGLPYRTDTAGWPLHPIYARMMEVGAVSGPGAWWRLGPNWAADTVMLRRRDGNQEVLLIQRGDTGTWALPGGMHDAGESLEETAIRELKEEAGVDLKALGLGHGIFYRGIGADARTTLNAWPETQAILVEVPDDFPEFQIQAGDDAADAKWTVVTAESLAKMFGSHALMISLALKKTGL